MADTVTCSASRPQGSAARGNRKIGFLVPTSGETAGRARLQIQRLLDAIGKLTGRRVYTVDMAVAELERYGGERQGEHATNAPDGKPGSQLP